MKHKKADVEALVKALRANKKRKVAGLTKKQKKNIALAAGIPTLVISGNVLRAIYGNYKEAKEHLKNTVNTYEELQKAFKDSQKRYDWVLKQNLASIRKLPEEEAKKLESHIDSILSEYYGLRKELLNYKNRDLIGAAKSSLESVRRLLKYPVLPLLIGGGLTAYGLLGRGRERKKLVKEGDSNLKSNIALGLSAPALGFGGKKIFSTADYAVFSKRTEEELKRKLSALQKKINKVSPRVELLKQKLEPEIAALSARYKKVEDELDELRRAADEHTFKGTKDINKEIKSHLEELGRIFDARSKAQTKLSGATGVLDKLNFSKRSLESTLGDYESSLRSVLKKRIPIIAISMLMGSGLLGYGLLSRNKQEK